MGVNFPPSASDALCYVMENSSVFVIIYSQMIERIIASLPTVNFTCDLHLVQCMLLVCFARVLHSTDLTFRAVMATEPVAAHCWNGKRCLPGLNGIDFTLQN